MDYIEEWKFLSMVSIPLVSSSDAIVTSTFLQWSTRGDCHREHECKEKEKKKWEEEMIWERAREKEKQKGECYVFRFSCNASANHAKPSLNPSPLTAEQGWICQGWVRIVYSASASEISETERDVERSCLFA